VVQHISAKGVDKSEDENDQPPTMPFIFDILQPYALRKCPFLFTRIGEGQNLKSSVLWRVKNHAQPKPLVINKITKRRESSNPLPQEQKDLMLNRLDSGNRVQSSIPSCMKRFSTHDVKIDGLLWVKRYTMVFTDQ